MTNKRYTRGRNFEYLIMDLLRKRGYFCVRSAGSKGPVDIVAIKGLLYMVFSASLWGTFQRGRSKNSWNLKKNMGLLHVLRLGKGRG